MTLDRRADGDGIRALNTYDGMMQRQRRQTIDAAGTLTSEAIYISNAEELRFGGEDGDLYVSYVRLGSARIAELHAPAEEAGEPLDTFNPPPIAPWSMDAAVIPPPPTGQHLPGAKPPGSTPPLVPALLALLAAMLTLLTRRRRAPAGKRAPGRVRGQTRVTAKQVREWGLRRAAATLATALFAFAALHTTVLLQACQPDANPTADIGIDADVGPDGGTPQILGELYFIHSPSLGTPALMTDSAGEEVMRQVSTPFGVRTAMRSEDQAPTRFYFTDKERDQVTGYVYFGARFYDPSIGRWLSYDPLVLWGGGGLADVNAYAYVGNGATVGIDPDGLTGYGAMTYGGADTENPALHAEAQQQQRIYYPYPVSGGHDMTGVEDAARQVMGRTLQFFVLGSIEAVFGGNPANAPGPDDEIHDAQAPGWDVLEVAVEFTPLDEVVGAFARLRRLASQSDELVDAVSNMASNAVGSTPRALDEMVEAIVNNDRVGSGLKPDLYHYAASFLSREQLALGEVFVNVGGDGVQRTLLQVGGELDDVSGVFEYVVDVAGLVSHQAFIPGGTISGSINGW